MTQLSLVKKLLCLTRRNIRHDFSDSLRRGRDQRLLNEIAALVVKEPRPVLGIWGDNKSAFIEFFFAWEVVARRTAQTGLAFVIGNNGCSRKLT